ncbi:Hsp33 family molecular chaperone HslO [Desulfosediminicola flagellatus]|uniref:Hsp33 family molecular chaperone HslO n=1 Tax=Desulfosediminicola flagellatus TaxID=2569541 RepID=UPI0010ABE088|nr:Hsp33 family molecular chaperone HslO [Desulfosediminicola flagellatus]
MTDILHRAIADDGKFFGLACDTTQLVNEACRKHDVGPTAAAALGRALTGSILLAALLKDGQYVQLKFEGSGPLGKIITEAGYDGWSRGYVAHPRADVPLKNGLIDVGTGLGKAGFLTVTKDIGGKRKYQGMTQLFTSEIGEDIAYYLLESEQTPSVVALSVHLEPDGTVRSAGGYLIQALPPIEENTLNNLEKQIKGLPQITELFNQGKSPAEILTILFKEIPHHQTANTKLVYQCSCSREKMENAVFSLGKNEIQDLLENQGGAEVYCEFCRDTYTFDKDDLEKMLAEDTQIH